VAGVELVSLTVGPLQENCHFLRASGAAGVLAVDPGAEAPRLLDAVEELGAPLVAILLTHTHFDHVGAVAAMARASGAEVWVPRIERPALADIDAYVPWPELGPFESYDAEHDLDGGERLELAGLSLDVLPCPGHSPGHVAFSLPAERVLVSGDVLFRGSVGRTDLPGGDPAALARSIRALVEAFPPETAVYPGHGPATTLGDERASNPFLTHLAV